MYLRQFNRAFQGVQYCFAVCIVTRQAKITANGCCDNLANTVVFIDFQWLLPMA